MRLPKRLLSYTFTILALVAVVGTTFYQKSKRDKAKTDSAQTRPGTAPPGTPGAAVDAFETGVAIPVECAKVVKDTLVLFIDASGQAEALRQITITSDGTGRVAMVGAKENDELQAGSVVLTLDTTDFVLNLAQARLGVLSANATYKEKTLTDNLIADPAVRAARDSAARLASGVESAQIRLQQAQIEFDRSKTKAPFTGRVADVKVATGQRVSAGTEIMKLLETDPIRVVVNVLESDVGLLVRGRKARVTFAAYPGQPFTGVVETINPMVDQTTRTARVTILVANAKGQILPGMYARTKIEARKYADRIIVPRGSVLTRSNGEMLFVVNPTTERAEWRYVTTGLGNDEVVEIVPNADTKMVAPAETVLTGGHYTLAHDTKVKCVEKATAAGGRPD